MNLQEHQKPHTSPHGDDWPEDFILADYERWLEERDWELMRLDALEREFFENRDEHHKRIEYGGESQT